MSDQQQQYGSYFQSDGGDMNIAKDQGTAIQIHELHMYGHQHPRQCQVPRHLPPLDEHFVGREQQLADILDMLHPGKVVTLCGPGGIGKSALAAQAVRQIEPERFPDGILFHSFYTQPDPLIALEYIARSFGIEPKPEPSIAARIALSRKRALLILDGAEEAGDLRPILHIRGDCGVLITSRRKQDALACRLDIPPLARAAAADLLQAWGGSQLVNAAFTQQLCDRLGGWPIAIRLAGHYLNVSGETASEYLEWLEKQPIEALDHGDHRDKSIKALLSRNVAQFSDKARQALAIVGQLAFAPLSVDPIACALDCEMRQCRTTSAELVNYGLLQRTDDQRYEVSHPFIHAYARAHLPLPPEHLSALAAYYREFINAHNCQGRIGYLTLNAERTHIMQILETCQEQARWELVCAIVEEIHAYLDLQGYWMENQAALKMYLFAVRQQGDHKREAWCVNLLGNTYSHQGNNTMACTYYEQGLSIFREIGHKAGEAVTLLNLAGIARAPGDFATALLYAKQALAIYREIGDKRGEASALNRLGELDDSRVGSREYFEQALTIYREIGDKVGEKVPLHHLSNICIREDDYATALTYAEQCLEIFRVIGDKIGEAGVLNNLGQIYKARGDYTRRLSSLKQGLVLYREIGYKDAEKATLETLSKIYNDNNTDNYARKLTNAERSLAMQRENGHKTGEMATLKNLAGIASEREDFMTALSYLKQTLANQRAFGFGDKAGESMVLNELAGIARAYGDFETALPYAEQALSICREIGNKAGEMATLKNLAGIASEREDFMTARNYLEQALAICREIGDKDGANATLETLSQIYNDCYTTTLTDAERSLSIQRENGHKADEVPTLKNLAGIASELKDILTHLENMLAICPDEISDYTTTLTYAEQILTIQHAIDNKAREDYATALTYAEQGLSICREIGYKAGEANTSWHIGLMYKEQNELTKAEEYMSRTIQIEEEIGDPELESNRHRLELLRKRIYHNQKVLKRSSDGATNAENR